MPTDRRLYMHTGTAGEQTHVKNNQKINFITRT